MAQTETKPICEWQYLEKNPDSWRKQLFLKGRNIKASTVWIDTLINNFSPEETAEDKDLPLEAVKEAIRYCEANRELLEEESKYEYSQLTMNGIYIA